MGPVLAGKAAGKGVAEMAGAEEGEGPGFPGAAGASDAEDQGPALEEVVEAADRLGHPDQS